MHEIVLVQSGLKVPSSLTSSDGQKLLQFVSKGNTIVKTISGIRANSRLINPKELYKFDNRQGPIHLQRFIPDYDIRAHVICNTVHTELIKSDEPHYRSSKNCEFLTHSLPYSI